MVKMKHLTMAKGSILNNFLDCHMSDENRKMGGLNQLTCRLWSGVRLFLMEPELFMKGQYGCKGDNLKIEFI